MRVAVIGGTGFVGSYLVSALLDAGHELSLLVRPGSEHKVRQPGRCRIASGHVGSSRAIDACLDGCDAVVYCIGILREDRSRDITFEALQYEGVERVVTSAKKLGIRRFLLMSANGIKMPGTPYQETKARAEDIVREAGFDATIFRPSVIFGEPTAGTEFATQLYTDMILAPVPAVSFFSGLTPSNGHVVLSPVHVTDVARAFAVSLANPVTVGRVYALGGPEVLTWPQILERIADAVSRRKWIVPVPMPLMYMAAALLDRFPAFPVTRDQLTMLRERNVADPTDLESLIDQSARPFRAENLSYLNMNDRGHARQRTPVISEDCQ